MKLPRPRPGETIKAEHIRQLSDAVRSITPISSRTILASRTPNGTALQTIASSGSGSGRALMPLEALVASQTGNNTKVKVVSSTVLGVVPTMDGIPLDDTDPPLLTIPNSGTRHICLNFRLKHTAAGGFVYPIIEFPASGSKVSLTAETTEPGAGAMQGTGGNAAVVEYQALLATFVNGVRTVQAGYGAITGELCDTLEGTNTATLNLTWGGVL